MLILLTKNCFSIAKVGYDMHDDTTKSLVIFRAYTDKMWFHFWRDGINHGDSVSHSTIFPNNQRPNNEWYKVQLIQSTHDDKTCRQELKIKDRYVWQQILSCPSLKTGIQDIYTTGTSSDGSKSQIRNFKFFSYPLSTT